MNTIMRRTEIVLRVKNDLIQYVMTRNNIDWLSDDDEKEIYLMILNQLERVIDEILRTGTTESLLKKIWLSFCNFWEGIRRSFWR